MYAITGITGQVGGAVARTLLAAGHPVRAVLRDRMKAAAWAAKGCDVALADMTDLPALTAAFRDTAGVFILLPPVFDPQPGFPEARQLIDTVQRALAAARSIASTSAPNSLLPIGSGSSYLGKRVGHQPARRPCASSMRAAASTSASLNSMTSFLWPATSG